MKDTIKDKGKVGMTGKNIFHSFFPSIQTFVFKARGKSRRSFVYLYDVVVVTLILAIILLWRYHFETKPLPLGMIERSSGLLMILSALFFPMFQLHRRLWRYTSLKDVLHIIQAVACSHFCLLPLLFLIDRLDHFPRSVIFVAMPLSIMALAVPRLAVRGWRRGDLLAALSFEDRSLPWAIIVADLNTAADYVAELRRSQRYKIRILGFVTTGSITTYGLIDGIEILGGLSDLKKIVTEAVTGGEDIRLILAEPKPDRSLVKVIIAIAAESGVRVMRRRTVGGLLSEIGAVDLLDRPPQKLNLDLARNLVKDKRVFITGAGGSIGSELTRQILELSPKSLILNDVSEYNLYLLDQNLRDLGLPKVWTIALGDVRDQERMQRLFALYEPEIVVHAAALKHVPLMENHPTEAVLTNIAGVKLIAELSRNRASAFVFISTDKAVNPTNVMGATKRLGEAVVFALCAGSSTKAAVVRFGNVLGSTGSVVPLFEKQIAEGGPITVTHQDMVRYFMTVQEAVSLVLQAAALPPSHDGKSGVFVLDMGEPVRINDLARQMIQMHGLLPDQDISIIYTGLRPGEKLSEEIFYREEEVTSTLADGVFRACDVSPSWEDLAPRIHDLIATATLGKTEETLALLHQLVPQFSRTSMEEALRPCEAE